MKKVLLALALAVALPVSAQAGELSYTNVGFGYSNLEAFGGNYSGWNVNGSVAFGSSDFYAKGNYSDIDGLKRWEAGVGYHHALNDKADLLTELSYLEADDGGSINTWRFAMGVRSALTDKFEGSATVGYQDDYFTPAGFVGTIGGLYKFNDTWGFTGQVDYNSYFTTTSIGLRASF